MQVYDTANKLAQEIRDSEEYKLYKKRKDEIQNDSEKKQKVEEFEKLRYEVQLMAYTGEQKDEEKNKNIKEYFDLEVKFNIMIADVNKIIAEAIKDVL